MKIFGKEFKFNGFDIWHKGNFDPNSKAEKSHKHIKTEITDFPSSLPANGGNADTVDGKYASDFQQLTNGASYGYFPSTANTMIGNEYNILLNAHKRGLTITQTGVARINTDYLFDGRLAPAYSSDGIPPDTPTEILIEGLPNKHTQTGGLIGWTCRYWYPSRYKIEAYDSYNERGWKVLIDQSTENKPTKELVIPIYSKGLAGSFTKLKITIYESSVGGIGSNGYKKFGISELFFHHPEAIKVHQYLDVDTVDGKHASDFADINHNHDSDYQAKISSRWVGVNDGSDDCYIDITDSNPTHNGESFGGEFKFVSDKALVSSLIRCGGIEVLKDALTVAGYEVLHRGNSHTHQKSEITDFPTSLPANGGNADTIDGKNVSDFAPSGYGLGSLCRTVTGDWNDHTLTGFYMGYDLANQAPGGSWRYCIVMKHNDLWVSQTMMDFNGTGVYQRNKINGTWGSWRKLDISKTSELINDSNFTTATGHTHSTLDSNIKLGSGGSCEVTQDSGSWWQKLFFTDTSDKNVHRFGFSERQGSGDYIELFGADGYGNIYGKGQKLSKEGHTHSKSNITDFPTKLSEFENDIGAGGGTNIICSKTEPTNLKTGEWWYKE